MTQPGVSQHIKDLERSLGTTLFERGQRGVKLTSTGQILYPYAQQILELVAKAEGAVVNVAALAEGQVCLGATPGVSIYILAGVDPDVWSPFSKFICLARNGYYPADYRSA